MSMQQEIGTRAHRARAVARSSGQSPADTIDQSGGAILDLLQKAADAAKSDHDQALAMVHELSLELRAAEDRAEELEVRIKQLEGDNRRAEEWLALIHKEIDKQFLQHKEMGSQRL